MGMYTRMTLIEIQQQIDTLDQVSLRGLFWDHSRL